MSQIASLVLGIVNAPYGANLAARQLAQSISDIDAAKSAIGPVLSFFSEVPPDLQNSFVSEMGISPQKVHQVATHLQSSCPFPVRLLSKRLNEDSAAKRRAHAPSRSPSR